MADGGGAAGGRKEDVTVEVDYVVKDAQVAGGVESISRRCVDEARFSALLSVRTKEGADWDVLLSPRGYQAFPRAAGGGGDAGASPSEEEAAQARLTALLDPGVSGKDAKDAPKCYETMHALLMAESGGYMGSFGDAIAARLGDLSQLQGMTFD